MRRTGTTRRNALAMTGALAAAAVLPGCGSDADDDTGDAREDATHGAAPARAEKALRAGAARTAAGLLAGYEHVLTAHPATAAALTPMRDAARAHLAAVSSGKAPALGMARSRATGPAAAVRELAAAEREAADAYTALLPEAPGELARLLASVAAACAAHAYLLTELAKETPA
ncbi:hypothetical protein [Streptomyces sp. NBC_00525]|uniref:hypothetical protein n=1 Tax=Streptomyces sp. NBC_00525 TaxID=2903660 RepID=UPI002E819738|nr:hypothetical protein [Streptomyces sp. NBC_00525]WUC97803.1 hypothetical protein OG710_22800 [Streptomyces sp. NBC_00525]